MAATFQWFTGVETGGLTEFTRTPVGSNGGGGLPTAQTGTVRTGTYAVKNPWGARCAVQVGGLASTLFVRGYFKASAFPTNDITILGFGTSAAFPRINIFLNTDGTIGWFNGSLPSAPTLSGSGVISTSAWNLIELKFVRDAAVGGVEVYLNGVLQFSTFVTSTTTGTSATSMVFYFGNDLNQGGSNISGVDVYWDDMAVATGAYIGAGGSIAVQGKAGAPTYDAWTKNGDTTAALCWSETPFATGKNCSDTAPNDRQTMLVNDTVLNSLIGAGDSINAAYVGSIAKAVTSGSAKTTRRIGGVDTDGADRPVTTTDTFFPNTLNLDSLNIFTDTRANLGAAEIGFVRGATGSGNAVTIEDVWLLVDFAPNPNTSITPGAGSLTLTGQQPLVSDSDSPKIQPGTGSLNITGYAPGSNRKTPAAGALALVGQQAIARVTAGLLILLDIVNAISSPFTISFDILPGLGRSPDPLLISFDIENSNGTPLLVSFDILPAAIVDRSSTPEVPVVGGVKRSGDVQGPVAKVVLS